MSSACLPLLALVSLSLRFERIMISDQSSVLKKTVLLGIVFQFFVFQ